MQRSFYYKRGGKKEVFPSHIFRRSRAQISLCKSDGDERFYAYYPYIWTYIMLRDTKGNAPGNQNNIVISFSVGS